MIRNIFSGLSLFGATGGVGLYISHEEKKRQEWFNKQTPEKQDEIRRKCPHTYSTGGDLSGVGAVSERQQILNEPEIDKLANLKKKK